MKTVQTRGRSGAFTLIELLVVLIIIAIVVAIVVPSLGHARNSARASSTQGLMASVLSAAAKFETDHRRLPGYFTPREMGIDENGTTQGFSAVENIMLDLAGGVVGTGTAGAGQISVGPGAALRVVVDTRQIGTGETYFNPPTKFYVAQTNDGQQAGVAGQTAPPGVDQLPDLVDAFGSPLLAWVRDESAVRPVDAQQVYLCREDSDTGASITKSARYYWASNAAFLRATALGKKALNQTYSAGAEAYSLIGENAPGMTAPDVPSLEAVLGSPNFPYRPPGPVLGPQNNIRAAEARGAFVLHSAGPDGYYFGSKDRGGRMYAANGILQYGWTQLNIVTQQPHTDRNGNPTNLDIVKDFDDILATGSN